MDINEIFEQLLNTLANMKLQLMNGSKGKGMTDDDPILGDPPPVYGFGSQVISSLPKHEFPKFDGFHPRAWMLKCNEYFKVVPNIPDEQRIVLASMYFEGKAASWYQNFSSKFVLLNWKQFMEVISARFEDLREAKIVEEFNQLKHTGDYMDYVGRFEELNECMLMFGQGIFTETYFMAGFLTGLSEDVRAAINLFSPTSLEQMVELGKDHVITRDAVTKKIKGDYRSCTNLWFSNSQEILLPNQAILTGSFADNNTTLRFANYCQRYNLQLLINRDNAWSSMKESITQSLGCEIETATPLLINVAKGRKLISSFQTWKFKWKIQGHNISHFLRVLQYERSDTAFRDDWLKTCTSMELNHKEMTVTIQWVENSTKVFVNKSRTECRITSYHPLYEVLHTRAREDIKEFMHARMIVLRWLHCLREHKFLTRISQRAFQLPLDRGVINSVQQKWIVELLGQDYETNFQKMHDNMAFYELSRVYEEAVIIILPNGVQENLVSYNGDNHFQNNVAAMAKDPPSNTKLTDSTHEKVNEEIQKRRVMMHYIKENPQVSHSYKPYTISEKNAQVAYRLNLLPSSKFYPVSHVSMLKKKSNEGVVLTQELPDDSEGEVFCVTPCAFLKKRAIGGDKESIAHVLVRWEESENSIMLLWEYSTSVCKDGLVRGGEVKLWLVVEAPTANEVVLFYKVIFRANEVSHANNPTGETVQELSHIISADLKIESSIVFVFDLTDDSSSPIRSAVNSGVFCPETEEVEAVVLETVEAGTISEDEEYIKNLNKKFTSFNYFKQGSINGRRDAVNTTIKVGEKLQIGEIEEEISEKKKERKCEGVIPFPESPIPNGEGLFQQLLGSVLGLREVQQQGEVVVLLQVQVRVPPGIERLDFSSWKDYKSLIKKINAPDPWGQGSHKGGSNVVTQLSTEDEGVMAKKKKRIDGDDCNDQDSIFGARREKLSNLGFCG
ncbi:hypothetical protein C2S52_021707 [Perilla frutescens var. hirtella]|nr:hypothetical protein C2S52_021707 [Perilla frutescens var. hirtella]